MRAPDILKKVAGFVLKMGGTNDHIAITFRQAGKPCLIAGDHFYQPENNAPVTLVAGSFKGTEGACLVSGNQTAEWLAVVPSSMRIMNQPAISHINIGRRTQLLSDHRMALPG